MTGGEDGSGEGTCPLLTQKQQLKVKSRYLRQTVPHVDFFSLNSPILGGKGRSDSPHPQGLTGRTAGYQWGQKKATQMPKPPAGPGSVHGNQNIREDSSGAPTPMAARVDTLVSTALEGQLAWLS